jgi:head-tail adaptor
MNLAGSFRHLVTLEQPGPSVPDGEGGFTQSWDALDPSPVKASIVPPTVRNAERFGASTVITSHSRIVTCWYHPGITTKTRLTFRGRVMDVLGVVNPEERNELTVLLCNEVET